MILKKSVSERNKQNFKEHNDSSPVVSLFNLISI